MTKNEPGKFDCHAKAADDEPLFTLRAKDPIAPAMVRAWRFIRAGELVKAVHEMGKATRALEASGRPLLPLDCEKSAEAQACSSAMEAWRILQE
jgi:hypothetical protein